MTGTIFAIVEVGVTPSMLGRELSEHRAGT